MNDFSLALLGDGVLHRWGAECVELRTELERLYSQSNFHIHNHGLTNSRVGNGLWRLTADYEKDGEKVRHLSFVNPDIIVVESFAYTQFWDGPEGLSEYRDLLRRIWDEIERTTSAKRLFCVAPAPPRDKFLEGARNFQNTSKAQRSRFADGVLMYLNEARSIAEDEGWLVADAQSEVAKLVDGGESARRFVDGHDNFHLSKRGLETLAKMIVRGLDNGRMIEERIAK